MIAWVTPGNLLMWSPSGVPSSGRKSTPATRMRPFVRTQVFALPQRNTQLAVSRTGIAPSLTWASRPEGSSFASGAGVLQLAGLSVAGGRSPSAPLAGGSCPALTVPLPPLVPVDPDPVDPDPVDPPDEPLPSSGSWNSGQKPLIATVPTLPSASRAA